MANIYSADIRGARDLGSALAGGHGSTSRSPLRENAMSRWTLLWTNRWILYQCKRVGLFATATTRDCKQVRSLRDDPPGAGCFWHVEHAIRQLQGVLSTQVGYAGGEITSHSVTYEEVCQGNTGHAEVVKVCFDPTILPADVSLDCFLALHDPTKTRALGKHAVGTGQYRSCIFVQSTTLETIAHKCIDDCRAQLGKELSTEIVLIPHTDTAACFHLAEERHQRHNEKRELQLLLDEPLSSQKELPLLQICAVDWLSKYGKRSKSIMGSAETIQ